MDVDVVFKALADPSRRELLDRLNADNGQRLVDLSEGLEMTRQAVSRHLAVLEAANLVTTVRRGRDKLHYVNPVPINEIADRWIGTYDRHRLAALAELKQALEEMPVPKPDFVYTTFIRTTPERLWRALTDGAFTRRYWFGGWIESDWRVGSPVRFFAGGPNGPLHDQGQVLECEPYRRLSYTWTVEFDPELRAEGESRVTFELEPLGAEVKLTLLHDRLAPDGKQAVNVRTGWPQVIAGLKSLLEVNEPGEGGEAPSKPRFVYTTYIRTTPERLWQALTEPAFTERYWGDALRSDWKVGSPVLYKMAGQGEFRDLGEVVLEYDPYRRLAYTWHSYQPEHKAMFGWTDEQFRELVKEPRSKVAFELEPNGETVKLTMIHDGFERETEMLKRVSGGWPQVMASLKTLLESGEPLPWPEEARPDQARARQAASPS